MRSNILAILAITFSLLSFDHAQADDSKSAINKSKVLFVGNSYTSSVEGVMNYFVTNTNHQALFKFHTVGGSHLSLFADDEIEYGKDFLDAL